MRCEIIFSTYRLLQISKIITSALDKNFPEGCGVRIIAEPGRYFVASAFTLACCVYAKRQVCPFTSHYHISIIIFSLSLFFINFFQLYDDEGDVKHAMYFLNDGVYGSFNCILYDHQEVTAIPLKVNKHSIVTFSIWLRFAIFSQFYHLLGIFWKSCDQHFMGADL